MESHHKHSIHSQERVLLQEQIHNREAFDKFLANLSKNTLYGIAGGLAVGILFRKKRFAAIGAGVGGGIALN